MGTETKKGTTDSKDFKPFLTSEEVKEALEQRHIDLLSGSKESAVSSDCCNGY
jgi:hypothetical protein